MTFVLGWGLSTTFADADTPTKLHGLMIAATGWFTITIFGSLPFLTISWIVINTPATTVTPPPSSSVEALANPLNALFESMSGFTGTGLTMVPDEGTLPHTVQWWRSLTEWIGGVGVIVLTTAALVRPGAESFTLYKSEARSQKIHPSIVSTVRTVWWIYVFFTSLSILVLWLAGLPLWHAINHGMTAISTGGFAVIDGSIGAYNNPLIELVLLPIMIAGGIAFPVHYLVLQDDFHGLYDDLQTRWFAAVLFIGTIFLCLGVLPAYDGAAEALQYSGFQFVSAVTATGFQTATDPAPRSLFTWPTVALLIMVFRMVIGAAAGSTAGGIKIIRLAMPVKGIRFQILSVFYPGSAVRRLQFDDRILDKKEAPREVGKAVIISLLWLVFLTMSVFILILVLPDDAYPLEMILFEVASAQGNVGISTGITGPESLPAIRKVTFMMNLWIGRFEIIPALLTVRKLFLWRDIYE
ncbi:potassium transporter Trk [Haloarcula sebkhae]|uniref:Potassium transporter Trk n=2 Tax=Haloarcula TaxID=2237 RepID=A0A830EXN8_9EURY|nr:potassium transporter Trk [Haloarcula sebkhae]